MDQQDILQHLLQVEASASALVNDAQIEADRRVAESEKRGRALYDERYGQAVLDLEAQYAEGLAAVTETVYRQLEAYREDLCTIPVDRDSFFKCLESLLAKER
ncbi:MAG: hypothetical protein LBQ38_08950 [Spirochaetaceae bacterium]|jgi:vacuolar-type H+-ATPase subunit H|nr:hypothetical protein [Spirochaetaceae bacterium]